MITLAHERIESPSFWMAGIVFIGLAASMIPCIIVSLVYGESVFPFLVSFLIYSVLGLFCQIGFKMGYVRPVNVLVMLAVIWIISIGFGMIPFVLGGMPAIDALMESASGFTTAGCSTISDYGRWSNGVMFYRSLSNWIGGIMIILIVMLILPMAKVGNRTLVSNEMSGSGSTNMSVRLRDAAIQFAFIYLLLTAVMFLLLIITGTDGFDSLSLSLCTVSTGGLVSGDMEVNNAARVIMIVFMFLGGTNFYLHFKAIYLRKPGVYGQSSEFLGVLVWCIAMSIVMYFLVEPYSEVSPIETYLDSVFAVISSSTTTGYTLPEMDTWPKLSMIIMFAIAFVGASSGSTSGGVKMSRMIVLLKYLRNTVDHVLHPNTVDEIYVDGSPVSRDYVRMCAVVVFMFMVTICVFVVIFMLSGVESVESIEVVLAMITSLGTVDVDIAAMSPFLKVMMVIMMWAGRLEILVALAIINPMVWVEQYRDVRHRMANLAARCSFPADAEYLVDVLRPAGLTAQVRGHVASPAGGGYGLLQGLRLLEHPEVLEHHGAGHH